jgi:RNA polymerase sigma-70 factor, ECF subfamily
MSWTASRAAGLNDALLLSVIVSMPVLEHAGHGKLPSDGDAALRQLYEGHAAALRSYVTRFTAGQVSADDIVQETFIRAWRHLPELTADERPVRPWLFRVARNLVIDADRAARSRPVTIPGQPAEGGGPDAGLDQVLDRQLLAGALQRLSPTHRTVLVETFYGGSTLTALARKLGVPPGTVRSRLHYALHALRQHLEDPEAVTP